MLLTSLAFLLYVSASALAQQIVYNSGHNTTPITGCWSSGSMAVTTGPTYVFPANKSLTYPINTGISFSFDESSGWYEVLRYRINGNGSNPNCPTTVLNWAHGPFQFVSNGSLILTPIGDGYQWIEAPCAAQSFYDLDYNDTELYQSWQIFTDAVAGPQLYMYQFDGSPYPPMGLLSQTPAMLPTQLLRTPPQPSTTILKRSATNVAPPIHWWNIAAMTAFSAVLISVFLV